ncbi:MAG: Crp/Fnr family transcriptional regulator, partial [Deltaproteobacteria bacterium]|nr:Crp/Fnr family transcriptional regulator [Deltaproteobacteria bacterium]
LGEIAVLGDVPRTASLRAGGDVQLLIIKGPDFLNLLRENPDMSIQMIKLLVNRLVSQGREGA